MVIDSFPEEVSRRLAEWPTAADFDLTAMRQNGWTPTPLSEFIVKIASRCNLDCDYCYIYHLADQSWRVQPNLMTAQTIRQLAARIREHARTWNLPRVSVSLHGGEPLLAGPRYIDEICNVLREDLADTCKVEIVCQSNGTLVTEEIAAVLARNDVRVGISLDGGLMENDRHRLYRDGRSSFQKAINGIEHLRAAGPHTFAGLLVTVDIRNDPLSVYQAVVAIEPRQVDFLLPHGNWTTPPPMKDPASSATPYADWLLKIFDVWYAEPKQDLGIRIFQDIMNLILGGSMAFELLGYAPISLASIETDGSIELVDTLKSAYEGAGVTSFTLANSSFDEVLNHPGVVARQIGKDALHSQCLECPVVDVCGGGMYTHRYREGDGFKNPSVFCTDLQAMIKTIGTRLQNDLQTISGSAR